MKELKQRPFLAKDVLGLIKTSRSAVLKQKASKYPCQNNLAGNSIILLQQSKNHSRIAGGSLTEFHITQRLSLSTRITLAIRSLPVHGSSRRKPGSEKMGFASASLRMHRMQPTARRKAPSRRQDHRRVEMSYISNR